MTGLSIFLSLPPFARLIPCHDKRGVQREVISSHISNDPRLSVRVFVKGMAVLLCV